MHGDKGVWSELELHRFLAKFADPRFERMIRHWLALHEEGGIPRRGAVDPTKFRDILDMVWLMERHADGHYRYRLAGQAICDIHGGIRRGTDTASLFSRQAVDMFRPRWEAVLDKGQIVRAEGIVMLAGGAQVSRVERAMLPLRSDDGEVSVILGATLYERPKAPGVTTTAFPPTNVQCCRPDGMPSGDCL